MSAHRDVGEFFDRQAHDYHSNRAGMRPLHRITAQRIEAELGGDVLSVGGLWSAATVDHARFRVTIVDLSARMLKAAGSDRENRVRGDARRLPFGEATFDHVVMPLMLHHIAGRSGLAARAGARAALGQATSVLRPGGVLWISEFCVPAAVYAAELIAAPLTCRLLGLVGAPLVVMHTSAFYAETLESLGFPDVRMERIESPEARPTDLLRPVVGMPFLRIPRALYPIVPTLIRARAPS